MDGSGDFIMMSVSQVVGIIIEHKPSHPKGILKLGGVQVLIMIIGQKEVLDLLEGQVRKHSTEFITFMNDLGIMMFGLTHGVLPLFTLLL